MPLLYILTFIEMMILESLYIPLARRLRIGLHPASRHMSRNFTPAGGGIIFVAAGAVFALMAPDAVSTPFFSSLLIGGLLLACISFIDDIYGLPPIARLIVQLGVMAYMFGSFLRPETLDIFLIIVIGGAGLVNAFNFLDGINGMLTLYAIVVISTLIAALHCGTIAAFPADSILGTFSPQQTSTMLSLILCSLVAFLFFNFRSKALVFSGDVGSIFTGFVITVVLICICIGSRTAAPAVFVAVFAVDSFLTIIHRLFEGEQIMQPHRRHLYQHFAHNIGVPHLSVSSAYAALQAGINACYFLIPAQQRITYALIVYLALVSTYFRLRSYKRRDNQQKFQK